MRNQAIIVGIIGLVIAIFYEFFLKDILFISIGIGRVLQPIEDFPYSCRKIYGSENILQSCEDLWIDDEGRKLYGACTDLKSRHEWSPGYALRRMRVLILYIRSLTNLLIAATS